MSDKDLIKFDLDLRVDILKMFIDELIELDDTQAQGKALKMINAVNVELDEMIEELKKKAD